MMLGTTNIKKWRCAIDEPLQESVNGPTGYAWNHAMCYRLPVL